ncbi:MAG: L-histidine N(alpha)-methyltransferase [Betaproteobacteria bacterium]|nr:L-histidine N(alpha)-methyltransferase [Betaproteobacteria bacterium]
MPTPLFFQLESMSAEALAAEAAAGLRASPAAVSPKFFYDAFGSRLFDAITELDEYYPTRVEAGIFAADAQAIADAALSASGPAPMLVDLGAGNCAKAARLFPVLAPRRYVAVDISVDYLRDALAALQRAWPQMELAGVGQDFASHLALPAALAAPPGTGTLVFYPGSSIGNFAPAEALRLLRQMHALAAQAGQGGKGGLLIGADLVKDVHVLERAYDDALGVTAAFDLNLLRRLNVLLGADFDLRQWRHVARFDTQHSRIEMHLRAREALTVRWPGGERRFAAGEGIHTENSYKWQPGAFEALLREAGYTQVRRFTDARGWFGVFVAAV